MNENALKDIFLSQGQITEYSKNTTVFNEGELCSRIGMIIEGSIKIVTFTNYEQEVIINTLFKHNLFGDMLVFSSKPYYYGMGITIENSRIAYLNKTELLTILENKGLLNNFLQIITDKAISLKQMNKLYAHKNITNRIMFYLSEEKKKQQSNIIKIKSVTALANLLSLPRPSLSRSLHKMEKDKLLKIDGHYISLYF